MRRYLILISTFSLCLYFACQPESDSTKASSPWQGEEDRPHNPWVFRSVLDTQARMVTLALDDQLWVAYSADQCALYKAWSGDIDFDGAVYTTVHGPQPTSRGDGWIVNEFKQPWFVIDNGKEKRVEAIYKGHRLKNGQAELMYDLPLGTGSAIRIYERPEYFESDKGLPGFERVFTTTDVPANIQVGLKINVSSIAVPERIETDGEWKASSTEKREYKNLRSTDISGNLLLNNNGSTRFAATFLAKPTIENQNKVDESKAESTPAGARLIARSGCRACHNTYKKTIGPAYVEVAKRYPNNQENVAMLVQKVIKGGSGNWGEALMNPHPHLAVADIKTMIEYILGLNTGGETKTESGTEDLDLVYAQKDINSNDLILGALAEVFEYNKNLTKLSDLGSGGKKSYSGSVSDLKASGSDFKNLEANFAVRLKGYFDIKEAGVYGFKLASDDGSRLLINGELVIDHDGLHGASSKSAKIKLDKGYHAFNMDYFQAAGGKAYMLSWKPPSAKDYQPIPDLQILHYKKDRPKNAVAPPMASTTRLPGDGFAVEDVHPSYELSQARPESFQPKVGGMDFLPDGRLVVSTWTPEGEVFIVEGAQSGDPTQISVKRIAKGLAEPLGLKVVDNAIYVLQKQELTKLVDNDGDDLIDEYQTVCNGWQVSANFHEFAFGLVYKDGYFYATLATAILPGGASKQPQIPDRGKVVKIEKESGAHEFVAHGLRTPNGIGIGVDGEIFVADNQGDWLPSSKIVHVQEGAWYGSRSVDPEGVKGLKETLPVVWLPQDEIGNSPSTPLALNDGPYKGQMIHGEVTHGGVKRVFVENVNGAYQGALFRFVQGLEAGVNRMVWGPDGALYVGGIGSTGNWAQTGKKWYGLQRLKYNDKPTFEMLAVRAKSNGVEIEFTEPLQEGDGWETSDYLVKQWWYEPTENYGGPKMDLKNLTIKSVSVSEDRKRVFLELEGMKAGHVIYIQLTNHFISDPGNELWSTECWYTMNNIPKDLPGQRLDRPQPTPHNTLSESEKSAGWKLLFDGKTTEGWHNYNKQTVGQDWIIEDNALHLDAKTKPEGGYYTEDGGYILTDDEYENYELRLEWKIAPCGNSGIIYNVIESEAYENPYETGPEMQVLDNTCHPDAKIETHRAGDLYDMIACKYEMVKPAGTWNKVRLIVNQGKVEHWLNGHKVVQFEMFNDQWREMIANSKFKDMKAFGTGKKGRICLQDHDDPVWFRNIKIKEL